jgi:hypothetical protein
MTALINLKLSADARFQDKAGACKLIGTAVARGDQSMAPRLSECHARLIASEPPSFWRVHLQ